MRHQATEDILAELRHRQSMLAVCSGPFHCFGWMWSVWSPGVLTGQLYTSDSSEGRLGVKGDSRPWALLRGRVLGDIVLRRPCVHVTSEETDQLDAKTEQHGQNLRRSPQIAPLGLSTLE